MKINLSKIQLKIIVIVLALISLLLFNLSFELKRTPIQNDFDQWLNLLETSWDNSHKINLGVSVRLMAKAAPQDFDWRLSANNAEETERILRLLQLAREANIFSRAKSVAAEDEILPAAGELILHVHSDSKSFVAKLSPKLVKDSVSTQNLFKLFQIYAMPASV